MNIIVCTKPIRHTYARTGKDPASQYIAPEDSIFRVNPCDESALELALRVKDSLPQTTVMLLTLGTLIAESQLRRCLAAGADLLYRINVNGRYPEEDPLAQPDPWTKSDLLARAAKDRKADLILCGKESLDRQSGQVGAFLAHRLDMPFVSAISELSVDPAKGTAQVQRSAGRGVREVIECDLPAVFSVDAGIDLRLPTVPARRKSEARSISELSCDGDAPTPRLIRKNLFQPKPRTKVAPAPDSRLNAYDRILQLLIGSKVEKKGEMLTGDVETQVAGIVAFLQERGLLDS